MKTNNIKKYKKWSWKDSEEKEPFLKTSRTSRDLFMKLNSEEPPDHNNEKASTQEVQESQESLEKVPTAFSKSRNKREDTYNKMADREMMRQVGMNPYLNNSYVDGITIRDTYLMPYAESKPNLYNDE